MRQWDSLADRYVAARPDAWPAVVGFLTGSPEGARVLDIGSAHGRHAAAASGNIAVVASDVSLPMARQAGARGLPAIAASATRLPFRDSCFNAAIMISVLHVVPGRDRRVRALAEMRRVLRPEGKALVTVWSKRELKFEHATPWPGGEPGDFALPWTGPGPVVTRFYHPYMREELADDLAAAGLAVAHIRGERIRRKEFPDNWFAVVKRGS